jgi:glycosyltransferase involved in cell wall biosynthesis
MTLISIVTPSYNQGRFLRSTIESVLSQTGVELDYIVVDGGSEDNSLEILKEYGSRFKWVSEPDKGQSDAINKGFRMNHGDVLGWLNSDDLYCPNALSRVVEEFEKDPNVMMVYGKGNHIDADGSLLDEHPSGEFNLEVLSYGCFICQPACFFRKSLFEAAGGLNSDLHYAMDLDLWIRYGKLRERHSGWRFKYLPLVLALSRMHQTNKTLSLRREAYTEIIQVVKRHFNHVPFNWIYGAEESADKLFDGFFRRSPLSSSLLTKSLVKWLCVNGHSPGYLMSCLTQALLAPRQSARRLWQRTLPPL